MEYSFFKKNEILHYLTEMKFRVFKSIFITKNEMNTPLFIIIVFLNNNQVKIFA